jgi:hypothetical protein
MLRFFDFIKKSKINICMILGIILIGWLITLKQSRVEERFGFTVGTPYIGQIVDRCEVLMINTVEDVGVFYQAGFRADDLLMDTAYQWVHRIIGSFNLPSGSVFYVETIPGGDGAKDCEEYSHMPVIGRKVIAS